MAKKKADPWWYVNGMPPDDRLDYHIIKAVESTPKKGKVKTTKKKVTVKKSANPKSRFQYLYVIVKGGPGSGHFGHAGRPPKRGGSLPSYGATEASLKLGMGAAVSIFSKGKYARVRQYLRSQGIKTKDVDAIIASGAADKGDLQLVGHRGGLAKRMGIAKVQPKIDAYKNGLDFEHNQTTEGRENLRKWIIEDLGGDPEITTLEEAVIKLDTEDRAFGQLQGRFAAGKLRIGDQFLFDAEGQGADNPYKIVAMENRRKYGQDYVDVLVRDKHGNESWVDHEDIVKWGTPDKAPEIVKKPRVKVSRVLEGVGLIKVTGSEGQKVEIPGPGDHDTFGGMMASGYVKFVESGGHGISETFVGEMEDGTRVFSKDSDGGYNISEKMNYDLSQQYLPEAKGMLTRAVIRADEPSDQRENDNRVLRVYAEGETIGNLRGRGLIGRYADMIDPQQFTATATLDAIGGNSDRHYNNLMLQPDGNVLLPDNDFAFGGGWGEFSRSVSGMKEYFGKVNGHYKKITGQNMVIKASDLDNAVQLLTDESFKQYVIRTALYGDSEWVNTEERLGALSDFRDFIEDNGGEVEVDFDGYWY